MEGWRPVEDIVRWGFGQAPVVMANEAPPPLDQWTGEEPAEDELAEAGA